MLPLQIQTPRRMTGKTAPSIAISILVITLGASLPACARTSSTHVFQKNLAQTESLVDEINRSMDHEIELCQGDPACIKSINAKRLELLTDALAVLIGETEEGWQETRRNR